MMEFEEDHDGEEEEEEEEEEEDDEEMAITPTFKASTNDGKKPGPIGTCRYRECLKNHAICIGGHAVDGCGEFMPAGAEGTLDALKCAACNCHRNFHRKEIVLDSSGTSPHHHSHHHQNHQLAIYTPRPQYHPHPHPHPQQPQVYQFYPYNRTSAANPTSTAAAAAFLQPRPLALPSPSTGGTQTQTQEQQEDLMVMMGAGTTSSRKKRFRTKFTQEQKEKMLQLAEQLGWRIQKQDEGLVQNFCNETGVRRHVLKVWMHNNKHTLGKKP